MSKGLSVRFSGFAWWSIILTLSLACSIQAAGLIPCPDCESPVSHRAIMCPKCGCPGKVIAEAFATAQAAAEKPTPGPVVRVEASAGKGHGVAVTIAGERYIVMDARLVWDAEFLNIRPALTNTPIAYRDLQLAKDVPLARFRTDTTNLSFLAEATIPTEAVTGSSWLLPGNAGQDHLLVATSALGESAPIALVDVHTNVLGVVYRHTGGGYGYALPRATGWIAAAPGELRAQTHLLAKARQERVRGRLALSTQKQLKETQWLTNVLRSTADRFAQLPDKETIP